jgi:hypothetical protein
MAHSPHAKAPKLNALLIGKRTVPSGCRVLNVSQQGMSLQCNPDGRLLTFSNGDSVDIYLSVEHASGQNKFTIPAIVSHADENTIDVVFHCTDTELAGLIESYRTSESHNLEASIDHRRASRSGSTVKPVAVNDSLSYNEQPDSKARQNSRSFYAGLLILFISSLVLLGAYYYVSSINKRLNTLETVTRSHTDELAEVQTQVFSSRLQDGRYASLNARMKALTDAFQSFEKRVMQTLPREPLAIAATAPEQASEATVTSQKAQKPAFTPREAQKPAVDTTRSKAEPREVAAPPPAPVKKAAAVITDKQPLEEQGTPSMQKYPVIVTSPIEQATIALPQTTPKTVILATTPDKPVETETKYTPAIKPQTQPAASADTPTVAVSTAPPMTTPARAVDAATARSGPWIINLLSSPDKAYVDKAMAEARSRGFAVVTTSARVKGKQYWRLQIPGFESMAATKKAAEPVKEKMKIKDVWILKR